MRQAALGRRLRELRLASKLTEEQLAAAAWLDPAYYRDVEAGRADLASLTYLDLIHLADALAVRPAHVMADLRVDLPASRPPN